MAFSTRRALLEHDAWPATSPRRHDSPLLEQTLGAGPFVLVAFSAVANVRTTHRSLTPEGRAGLRACLEQFGLVIEAESEAL